MPDLKDGNANEPIVKTGIDSCEPPRTKHLGSRLISTSCQISSSPKSATQMKSTSENFHKRNQSPLDVISYEFDSSVTVSSHKSNMLQHQRSISTDSNSVSLASTSHRSITLYHKRTMSTDSNSVSLASTLHSPSNSEIDFSQENLFQKYTPPTDFALNSGNRHSVQSNNKMKELVDILQNRKQRLGPNHPKVADSLKNIGNAHFVRGEYDLSVDAFSAANSIYKFAYGMNHSLVASTLGDLGIVYFNMGKLEESTQALEDALMLYRAYVNGDENVEVAATLHNLGLVSCLSKDYEKAEYYLARALVGRRKVLGKTHVDVARTLDALGNVYSKMNEFVHSLKFHHNALRTKKAMLGSKHPSVVVSYMNIAHVHRELNEYDDAISFYRQAFEAQLASASDDAMINQEIGTTMHLIGMVQVDKKKNFEALKSFTQASKFYKKAGLTEEDYCVMKLKEVSYTVKKAIRGNRSFSCY